MEALCNALAPGLAKETLPTKTLWTTVLDMLEKSVRHGVPRFKVHEYTHRDWNLGVKNQRMKEGRLDQDTHDTAEDVASVWVLVSQSEVDKNSRFVLLNRIADG